MMSSGFNTSTSLSRVSSTTSAVLPISAPDNPVRATVPITVTTASSFCAVRGISTSAGPSSMCNCSSLKPYSAWKVRQASR